jgi:hypothetical protein
MSVESVMGTLSLMSERSRTDAVPQQSKISYFKTLLISPNPLSFCPDEVRTQRTLTEQAALCAGDIECVG